MSDGKRYEIEKIQDIAAIPEESFDAFLVDLKEYYTMQRAANTVTDGINKIFGAGSITVVQKFTWVDDGKHEHKVTVAVETEKKTTE